MSERIEAIRERLEALDYPAWAWEPFGEKSNNFIVGVALDGDDQIIAGRMPEDDDEAVRIESVCEKHDAVGYDDADFIAYAPTDIAYLLDRIEAQREVVEAARDYMHSGAVNERERFRETLERLEDDDGR